MDILGYHSATTCHVKGFLHVANVYVANWHRINNEAFIKNMFILQWKIKLLWLKGMEDIYSMSSHVNKTVIWHYWLYKCKIIKVDDWQCTQDIKHLHRTFRILTTGFIPSVEKFISIYGEGHIQSSIWPGQDLWLSLELQTT